MHHSPSPDGAGRAAALTALLALAALAAAPAWSQDAAPPPAEPLPLDSAASVLQGVPTGEPILEEEGRGGPAPWTYGLLAGGVVLVAGAAALFRRWRRGREEGDPEEPLLLFAPPATPPPALPHPARSPAARPAAPAAAPAQVQTFRVAAPVPAPARAPAAGPELADELTVRLTIPAEGRLQFLPGALEVLEGADRQREIRFLRGGGEVTEYTIGRAAGAPERHVQLAVPTVSRLHARMRFAEGAWTISNLSSTNPLRVNGRELAGPEDGHLLADGDRVEIGEVVLRYRGAPR
ncbi:MAG TPA: FHA domain-containing protein [Longimicrobiaceae bacterium]|nr:FHA domain-containing protein [Longimicrobiaceae bacterium]